jgi:L-ascorbate metabolism protein UlaG (beta-lactamase superfamily)
VRAIQLQYLAHSAFKLTTRAGLRVVIDPWRNPSAGRWFLREFPPVEADLVLVTHDHFDHDAVDRITGLPTVARHAIELKTEDLRVTGYADWHVPGHSSAGLRNVIFVLESGGVRVCHPGDTRFPPPPEIVDAIGAVDLLVVPVDDSCHLLSYEEVDGFIELFEPQVVIPVHYLIPGVTAPESTLESPDGWLAYHAKVRRDVAAIAIEPGTLPEEREIWVMRAELD